MQVASSWTIESVATSSASPLLFRKWNDIDIEVRAGFDDQLSCSIDISLDDDDEFVRY